MMNNQISIIIPTKNEAKRLETLFDSLVKQTFKNFEVIINDDRSTNDNTKDIIKRFSRRITIRHVFNNVSMAQSRKAAAKIAKGEYMLHLDADMILPASVLEECVSQSKKGYGALILPERSERIGYWSSVRAFEKSLYLGDETIESARFIETEVYWSVGGHNEQMVLSEDKDLDLRIRSAGIKIGRISTPIFHNEDYNLKRSMIKKFFYGKTANLFISSHPKQALIQGNLLFRPAYFRNWHKLLTNPLLIFGLFSMKFLEGISGLLGLLVGRYFSKIDPWRK